MAKSKSISGDFYHDFFCNKCNTTTSFKIHQFAMIKPVADKYKNAATAKCTVCGYSQALVLTGDLKTGGTKSKPISMIKPENVSISKTGKKKLAEKKTFFQNVFDLFKPGKKSATKKRGR